MTRVYAYAALALVVLFLAGLWPTRNRPHPEPDRRWRPTRGAWLLRRRDR